MVPHQVIHAARASIVGVCCFEIDEKWLSGGLLFAIPEPADDNGVLEAHFQTE